MSRKKIVIIGGGPAGYVAAIRASQLGGEVILIEKDKVGGTCLNVGCIPTKSLVACAELFFTMKKAASFGIEAKDIRADLATIVQRKDKIVSRLVGGVEFLLKKNKVEILQGEGQLKNPEKIEVTTAKGPREQIDYDQLILATGSKSAIPQSFNFDGKNVLSSKELLSLSKLPSHLLIVGGGVIGVEFASIFQALGSQVTIVEMLPRLIATEDEEISRQLSKELTKQGIKIKLQTEIERINIGTSGVSCSLGSGEQISCEKVLVAVGRKPNTEGFPEIGLKIEDGYVQVNERMETNLKNIYAIGDITGPPLLAHKASKEGLVAAENALGGDAAMEYRVVPNCIFTIPEVASVGLSEAKAKEEGHEISLGKFPFSALGRAHCLGETQGLVKIVADKETEEVLGIHIIGPHASDLIAEAALGIQMEATVEELQETIHAHPTLPEALSEAAHTLHGRGIHI